MKKKMNYDSEKWCKKDKYGLIKLKKKKMIVCCSKEEADELEREYRLFTLGSAKFEMVTYLRECFYGKKATTGKLDRKIVGYGKLRDLK
jgi:hypothetical protein